MLLEATRLLRGRVCVQNYLRSGVSVCGIKLREGFFSNSTFVAHTHPMAYVTCFRHLGVVVYSRGCPIERMKLVVREATSNGSQPSVWSFRREDVAV